MEQHSIYEQIAGRTNGTIYIGVVGPVRTGKSTFIKRFMEQLVLPEHRKRSTSAPARPTSCRSPALVKRS